MKLKTLKDLKTSPHNEFGDSILIGILKTAGIKRAKYYKEKMRYWKGHVEDYNYWWGKYDETMEFNNLTEEDLK